MATKEATARIKSNKLLEAAGWRFFPEGSAPSNIRLEPSVAITSSDLEALGENFEIPVFPARDFRAAPGEFRTLIPEYLQDHVFLNQFAA
jgi:hypothetical protein